MTLSPFKRIMLLTASLSSLMLRAVASTVTHFCLQIRPRLHSMRLHSERLEGDIRGA
jgi:hypothetical protein